METVLAKENPAPGSAAPSGWSSQPSRTVSKCSTRPLRNSNPGQGKWNRSSTTGSSTATPVINIRQSEGDDRRAERRLRREDFRSTQSVLAQRKDPDLYPEVTWVGNQFREMQLFREWTFGRFVALRTPQPADLPGDRLLPNASNLALVLNEIEHRDGTHFNAALRRFFPRFKRMTTWVAGGTVQFYLHESDI